MVDHDAGRGRVLVIEDSKADQSVYRRTLHAFDLEFADSGEAGLGRLEAGGFDLVLLDFHLPGIDGDEVLARIRGGPRPDLPVVIVTGGGSESVAVDLLRQGASDYVTKDEIHTPRVASAVLGVLEKHRRDRERLVTEAELRRHRDELAVALRRLQEAQGRLIQGEKMASLGQLVAGVAHEINNPLAYVTNNIAVIDRDLHQLADLVELYRQHLGPEVPDEVREAEERIDLDYTLTNLDRLLRSTRHGLGRVGQIVAGLRDFSRLDESENELVDPDEAVRLTVEMVRYQLREKEIRLTIDSGSPPGIWCNPGQLNQVLLGLLINAVQAVGPGSTIAVRTRSLPESGEVRFEVADNGPGIPEAIRGKVFDPFFTTKPQGVGTGLGLWIAYNIVEQHRGRIELETEVGRGTTFAFTLPVRRADNPS